MSGREISSKEVVFVPQPLLDWDGHVMFEATSMFLCYYPVNLKIYDMYHIHNPNTMKTSEKGKNVPKLGDL